MTSRTTIINQIMHQIKHHLCWDFITLLSSYSSQKSPFVSCPSLASALDFRLAKRQKKDLDRSGKSEETKPFTYENCQKYWGGSYGFLDKKSQPNDFFVCFGISQCI